MQRKQSCNLLHIFLVLSVISKITECHVFFLQRSLKPTSSTHEFLKKSPDICKWQSYGDTLSTENPDDKYGTTMGISEDGTTLAVGGMNQAFVYVMEKGRWQTRFAFTSSIAEDNEGLVNVALSNDGKHVVLGVPNNSENGIDSGIVKLFHENSNSWTQRGQTFFGKPNDLFGTSVTISGDGMNLVVGANGYVKYILFNSNGFYVKKFSGLKSEGFGTDVAISDDGKTMVVGVPYAEAHTGYFRVVDLFNAAFDNVIYGKARKDLFGFRVGISADGTMIGVGARGYVSFFEKQNKNHWLQKVSTLAARGDHLLSHGNSISLSKNGEWVAVGSQWSGDFFPLSGTIHDKKNVDGSWAQYCETQVDADNNTLGGITNLRLSHSGDRLVVLFPRLHAGGDGLQLITLRRLKPDEETPSTIEADEVLEDSIIQYWPYVSAQALIAALTAGILSYASVMIWLTLLPFI